MAKTKMSALAGKIAKSAQEPKELPVPGGGGDLPPGIENGVAKVTTIEIGEHGPEAKNAGKPYFMIRGVVVSPEQHEGVTLAGKQAGLLLEPLYDTPTRKRATEGEHIDYMVAVLQDFGVDDLGDGTTVEDGSLFAAMLQDDLYVKFRTWQGEATKEYPNPRVNVTYGGSCEFNGEVKEVRDTSKPAEAQGDAPWTADDAKELLALAKKADKGDDDAAETIADRAEALGIDPESDEYDGDNGWTLVAESIIGASTAGDEDDAEESEDEVDEAEVDEDEEDDVPDDISLQDHATLADDDDDEDSKAAIAEAAEAVGVEDEYETYAEWVDAIVAAQTSNNDDAEYEKGEIVYFKPPRAKVSKECEITAVFKTSKKLNLKEVETGKTHKGVAYDALEE